ncbi:DNA polymerase III subunit delta' [Tistrella mobilis]|uniref:ATPase involved in DNA replication n=1 Tax=Tistrella mobilis (strain KA081020-065) TaxID=1110502 RepID=I3TL79_TISMK|nr:DNA polymerase III subunit delta' [Tistrella mobilis]AFK53517.1 ATPase involved in DNA replication [Tistrella mobilis KA081020-065]
MSEAISGHPRFTPQLVGHEAAERGFLEAWNGGRLAHAWMITGPRGLGKATLAYRIARFVLATTEDAARAATEGAGLFGGPPLFDPATPPASLDISAEHPAARRIAAGSHPDLLVLERGVDDRGRPRTEITVGEARELRPFLGQTSAAGGWRVVIIDAADEMNRNAANSVLKLLEEPPAQALILMVAHAPGRLLPTIRSRARRLALAPLDDARMERFLTARLPELAPSRRAVARAMAEGAPGRALTLAQGQGPELLAALIACLDTGRPLPDWKALIALGEAVGRPDALEAYETLVEAWGWWMARWLRAHARAGGIDREVIPGEARLAARLAGARPLEQWVELWDRLSARLRQALSANLDRKQVLITVVAEFAAASG